ncbi:hypothetical protein KP509_07G037000 [Ceratopteris richardii]|uniref:Uncharacterized protein n=1 Tax=Ceratopteris richardii TaxID=49495 RepID=A0A8T2U8Z9_CERRI|nr:hypothetical protein KP509_07G037000 [Ceratopteris richardii]
MFTRRGLSLLGVYLMLLLLVLLIRPSPHDNPVLRKLLSPAALRSRSGAGPPPEVDP